MEMTVCMETADGSQFGSKTAPCPTGAGWEEGSAPAPGFIAEPAALLAVRVAAGPGVPRGRGSVPPGALLRCVLSIARSELDFKLIELVPLGFGSLPLRDREQFLQALTGGNGLLRGIHGGIIPDVPGPRAVRGLGTQERYKGLRAADIKPSRP